MDTNTGNNSSSASFDFKKGAIINNNKPEQSSSPVEETKPIDAKSIDEEYNEKLNREYVDKRSVTIMLVHNYSLYRKANSKSLIARRDYIGSCIKSSRTLTSNANEVNAYFPKLVGLSSNNENFITRVKQYLNNIQIAVNELGKKFDTSFRYNHYKDYLEIKKQEDAIEERYLNCNRNSIKDIKIALKEKIDALNSLESTKYQFGEPVNVDDYLMYRHCLLFDDIAKDTALINSDLNIRFYFKDDKKDAENKQKIRMEINRAKSNYVAMLDNDEVFNAIYVQYCVITGKPVVISSYKSKLEKEDELDKYSTENPVKFNKLFNDKDVSIKSMIEMLIERGMLIRAKYNQNITTPDGDFIGSNIKESVAWFKNPNNKNIVEAFKNKLNNY